MSIVEERIANLPLFDAGATIEPLTGGLSNESYRVRDRQGEWYVVRFGQDYPFHHVDREREFMIAKAAAQAGFAPEVVHTERGVMVSRFIEAKTLAADDVVRDREKIADLIRRFHLTMPRYIEGPGYFFWVFHVIRDYARTLQALNSRMTARLPEFLARADQWEVVQSPLPIVFGHHDLLPANFLDDGQRLWIIDFEYAGLATAMFDLAGIASNAEFDNDATQELLTAYFGGQPEESMLRSHSAMQCASLLREAMWSMVSELCLAAPGADYCAYTDENLKRLAVATDEYQLRFGD